MCGVVLFADDTNITSLNCSIESFNNDPKALNEWLNVNKLLLNTDKTVYLNWSSLNASSSFLYVNNLQLKSVSCKYLGFHIDSKLLFNVHINYVRIKSKKQCEVVLNIRHNVPKSIFTSKL